MTYIPNVNLEIVLNFYFQHRLWAGLWCSIQMMNYLADFFSSFVA